LFQDKVIECELNFKIKNGHKLNVEAIDFHIELVAMILLTFARDGDIYY